MSTAPGPLGPLLVIRATTTKLSALVETVSAQCENGPSASLFMPNCLADRLYVRPTAVSPLSRVAISQHPGRDQLPPALSLPRFERRPCGNRAPVRRAFPVALTRTRPRCLLCETMCLVTWASAVIGSGKAAEFKAISTASLSWQIQELRQHRCQFCLIVNVFNPAQ